jgi:hypothetical protein
LDNGVHSGAMDHLATGQKSENTIKLPESDSKKDVGNDQ